MEGVSGDHLGHKLPQREHHTSSTNVTFSPKGVEAALFVLQFPPSFILKDLPPFSHIATFMHRLQM